MTVTFFYTLVFPPLTYAAAAEVRPSSDIRNSGEIHGVVQFCGPSGLSPNGTVVDVIGESFSSDIGSAGTFNLRYVPEGAYTLRVKIPNQPEYTQPVTVLKGQATDVGIINLCEDSDGDNFTPDPNDPIGGNDCNDNNPNINITATELCDGIDNDCNGEVDGVDCTVCTDTDKDGFFAQAGCSTPVDCKDDDNTIRPFASELCDGIDNDCDGSIDEIFNLNEDPNNCGTCSNVCSSNQCSEGICLNQCGNGIVEAQNGEACDDGNLINGDGCETDCTVTAICGNGIVEGSEECDAGISGSTCCDIQNCTIKSASTVCRVSSDVCDIDESCNGSSPTCPVDIFAPSGTSCGVDATCDGSGSCI